MPPRCFVFVPGNHDVSWWACQKAEADQGEMGFDDDGLRRRLDAVKLVRYREFLEAFYGDLLDELALPVGRGLRLPRRCQAVLSIRKGA